VAYETAKVLQKNILKGQFGESKHVAYETAMVKRAF
jgi:hypothetical protein